MSASDHLSPQQFYHVTPKTNRSSIEKHGLRAESTDEGGLWMYSNREVAVRGHEGTNDLWRVRPVGPIKHGSTESETWQPSDPVWVTHTNVPADHVTRENP